MDQNSSLSAMSVQAITDHCATRSRRSQRRRVIRSAMVTQRRVAGTVGVLLLGGIGVGVTQSQATPPDTLPSTPHPHTNIPAPEGAPPLKTLDKAPHKKVRRPARAQKTVAARLPQVPYRDLIIKAARREKVDPAIAMGLIFQESRFNPLALNASSGARGLGQLMPDTAIGLGVQVIPGVIDERIIPEKAIDGGIKYLSDQIKEFGSVRAGVAAYNAGPGAVESHNNDVPHYPETQAYVHFILDHWTPAYRAGQKYAKVGKKWVRIDGE